MASKLEYDVKNYIAAVRRNPALAGDPGLLEELDQAANEGMENTFVTTATPIADYTWEARATFAGDADESPALIIRYPWPVRIIGLIPTVRPAVLPIAGGGVAPLLEDVLVSMTVNNEDNYTSIGDPSNTTNAGEREFVTLSTLNVLLPRLTMITIETPTPVVEFVCRWKQGANTFVDSIVGIAAMHQRRSPKTGRWEGRKV